MELEPTRKKGGIRVATLLCELCLSSGIAIGEQNRDAYESSCVELTNEAVRWADEIVLLPSEVSLMPVAEAAIDRWERCDEYSIAFPRFVVGTGRGRVVEIVIESRLPGRGYCGSFVGETITLYRRVRVNDERVVSCPKPDRILAHELGHVLGLRDMSAQRRCPTFIMLEITEGSPPLQRVAKDECRAVDRKWMTSQERDGVGSGDREGLAGSTVAEAP